MSLDRLRKQGFRRFVVDGVEVRLASAEIKLEKAKKHTIEVVVDTLVVGDDEATRLTEAVELARSLAEGLVTFRRPGGARETFSSSRACPQCGFSIEELTPRMFSFNSPFGACPECLGIGATLHADPSLIVPDRSKPIGKAISVWGLTPEREALERFGRQFGYDPDEPISRLSEKGWEALFNGSEQPLGRSGSLGVALVGRRVAPRGARTGRRAPMEGGEDRGAQGVLTWVS